MRTFRLFLLCCCLVSLALPAGAGAQESQRQEAPPRIWGALIKASSEPFGEPGETLDQRIIERLMRVFDYQHFLLLGEHTQPILAEYESWVVPSEELFMKVDSKGPVSGGLSLHLQLWRRENVVVKTDAILTKNSPVFIAGPMWGDDQLVFVIELVE